jgi:hypothetical protein
LTNANYSLTVLVNFNEKSLCLLTFWNALNQEQVLALSSLSFARTANFLN